MWSLDYLESVTYREVNKLLTGNNPKEELKPLKDVDETWNLKSSLIAHYNSAWEDMLQQIYDLKWESGGKADSKYILSKYIQINPAQYVSTLYGTGDNELFYNSSLTYPVLSDKLPATLKKMDKSNPSGFLPGVLTNYVPQDAIINDPILMKEHYIEAPELSQATADDIILQLPYFYENKQFGEEQSLSEFFYKYKSFDNFYWSNMTIMCGNHKRPGNCMTLLYIAKKFAADSDYNASDLVYKHVLQESNTLLTSSPVAKAFRYYAYKGMQSNADKQNHKLYSDLLSLIQATVSGYLISDASRLDEANYRDGMGKIINFVDTTAYNQRKMNKGKWLNVAKAVAGAAAANAGTITDAATGGETDATTAITNTATTLTNNMANTIDQNESMNENYYKIIAQANVSSKINAIQDVGDLDPNNRLAAQEILSFAQIDTTGAYVIPALEKYAADKPVLQGLVNDYKNALLGITAPKPTVSQPQNNDKGNAKGKKSHKQTSAQTQDNTVTANPVSADPATALLAVCKQLKKIERAIAKYELAGVPMPNDVQF